MRAEVAVSLENEAEMRSSITRANGETALIKPQK